MKIIFISFLLIFISCGHHKDVRPGDKGVHIVRFTAEERDAAYREASNQANHFCDQSDKTAAVLKEDYKYTGDMDEKDYKTAKRITKATKILSSSAWIMGGKRERNAGGVGAVGSNAADAVIGKGYTYTMSFKCVNR